MRLRHRGKPDIIPVLLIPEGVAGFRLGAIGNQQQKFFQLGNAPPLLRAA
jgi:hypothetical protein